MKSRLKNNLRYLREGSAVKEEDACGDSECYHAGGPHRPGVVDKGKKLVISLFFKRSPRGTGYKQVVTQKLWLVEQEVNQIVSQIIGLVEQEVNQIDTQKPGVTPRDLQEEDNEPCTSFRAIQYHTKS